jgi:hypothetical protein
MLARQLWPLAGGSDRSDVSQLLLQPFVNYNLTGGWHLASSPIVTANWNATSGTRRNFPIGGDVGKIFNRRRRTIANPDAMRGLH